MTYPPDDLPGTWRIEQILAGPWLAEDEVTGEPLVAFGVAGPGGEHALLVMPEQVAREIYHMLTPNN
jgi:hypothetical protein